MRISERRSGGRGIDVPRGCASAVAWCAAKFHRIVRPLLASEERLYRTRYGFLAMDLSESASMLQRFLGVYEAGKSAFVAKRLKPGDIFVDVGANEGYFSMIASPIVGREGRVVAVEPSPENRRKLLKSLRANEIENVQVIPSALSARKGTGFLEKGERSGQSRLSRSGSRGWSVEIGTVDQLLKSLDLARVDLMKVDVEGGELELLKGASRALEEGRIGAIALDLHPHLGVSAREVALELSRRRYSVSVRGSELYAELSPARNASDVASGG